MAVDTSGNVYVADTNIQVFTPGGTFIDGQCGPSNGGTFATAPTTNLCSVGTPSGITVVGQPTNLSAGIWTWTCAGLNGGYTATCSAVSRLVLYTAFVDYPGQNGTYFWGGSYDSDWWRLTPSIAQNMVAAGPYLYADFGSGGTWLWSGITWSELASSSPQNMVASESLFYANFGSAGLWPNFGSAGLWLYNGSTWSKLTPSIAQKMVASGSLLYADFGYDGIWLWNGNTWRKLTSSIAQNMVASGSSSMPTSAMTVPGSGTAPPGGSSLLQTPRSW